jgi:predicted RNA methylase
MKQQGNSINPANIQHFADSAKNAIQLGQRQFFTPPDLAAVLCTAFGNNNAAAIATDLMAGSGHLLTAANKPHAFGIDVDERSSSSIQKSTIPNHQSSIYQADITRYYPLAHEADLQHDLIVINPPFSLQWYLDRLAPLALSSVKGVKQVYTAALAAGDTMDSTLASFLIALDSLTSPGEGFMICNADTARRFLGCPQGTDSRGKTPESRQDSSSGLLPLASGLLRNVWCWLDIPGAIYEGQNTPFPTAVLYFSASHGHAAAADRLPLYLHAPSADPETVRRTLATAVSARPFAFAGRSVSNEYQAQRYKEHALPLWNAVKAEYHQLYHGVKPDWNLSLTPDGKIKTFLDPFRRAAYTHNRELLLAFQGMQGQAPAALVVQQVTRTALKHAITCGAWRVQPALVAAVDAACAAYESVRAPFYTPNEVQSLGWLDEESLIPCAKPGIPGFRPDHSYPIRTWIEDTTWNDTKKNLSGDTEKLILTGRELVVELLDDSQNPHHFHVRRDDATLGPDRNDTHHHHIQSLLNHFAIPIPRDVAQANPAAYQANLARIDSLESLINA